MSIKDTLKSLERDEQIITQPIHEDEDSDGYLSKYNETEDIFGEVFSLLIFVFVSFVCGIAVIFVSAFVASLTVGAGNPVGMLVFFAGIFSYAVLLAHVIWKFWGEQP